MFLFPYFTSLRHLVAQVILCTLLGQHAYRLASTINTTSLHCTVYQKTYVKLLSPNQGKHWQYATIFYKIFRLTEQELKRIKRDNYNFINNLVKCRLLCCRKKTIIPKMSSNCFFLKPSNLLLNLKNEYNRLKSKNHHVY